MIIPVKEIYVDADERLNHRIKFIDPEFVVFFCKAPMNPYYANVFMVGYSDGKEMRQFSCAGKIEEFEWAMKQYCLMNCEYDEMPFKLSKNDPLLRK